MKSKTAQFSRLITATASQSSIYQQSAQHRSINFSIFRSEENKKPDEEQGGGRKVPTGFEKLLKRSKKPISTASEDKPQEEKPKEEKKTQADEENLSEQEEESGDKNKKGESKKDESDDK